MRSAALWPRCSPHPSWCCCAATWAPARPRWSKAFAEAFQAASAEDVTSPTFTLVHEYRGPQANLYHIDLYRIDTPRQLETLGLDDLITDNSILLIEWGEKFARFERERDVEIALERVDDSEERFSEPAYGETSAELIEEGSENVRRIRITAP